MADNWIADAREFLQKFAPLELEDTVPTSTFNKAKAEFKALNDAVDGIVASDVRQEEVLRLKDDVIDRWQQYDYATKTGGRHKKTRKGKKRTTRRKKTSRR